MSNSRFQTGQRVVDFWNSRDYSYYMYKHVSVGVILDVTDREFQSARWSYVGGRQTRIPYTDTETKYRIRWTNGPKAGKITTMKHILSFDEQIENRRERIEDKARCFDKFLDETSKEQK